MLPATSAARARPAVRVAGQQPELRTHDRCLEQGAPLLQRCLAHRPPVQRIDMNLDAVDHGKAGILRLKGKAEVRAAKNDGFGALDSAQTAARGEERLPLLRRD